MVVDTSVLAAWLLAEDGARADSIIGRMVERAALAPSFWAYELANVLTTARRRKRITDADASRASELALALPITSVDITPARLLRDVAALARAHGLSVYDAAWLHVAATEGRPLATFDTTLAEAAREAGVDVITS